MSSEPDHIRRKELHGAASLATTAVWSVADGSNVDQRQVVGTIGAIEHGNWQQLMAPAKGALRILSLDQLQTLLALAAKENASSSSSSEDANGSNSEKKTVPLAYVEYCIHPLMNGRTCMMCLAIVDEDEDDLDDERRSVSVVSHGQKLRLNVEEAKKFDSANIRRQLTAKKLSLVLDLDHTLLHAVRVEDVTGEIPQTDDIYHFFIPGLPNQHVVKLRPGLAAFLEELSTRYDLFIYTHGTRTYAEQIAHIIDPKGTIFQHRIVARTDTPDMLHKSLKLLFPSCDDSMILVLDDRIDVWKENEGNVILIEPYHFFKSSAEINNASGRGMLEFEEHDDVASDEHLAHTKRVLTQVHERFFQHGGEPITVEDQMAGKGSDVKKILCEVKKTVLAGCHVVFSGLFPIQGPRPPESRYLWRLALDLGATPSMTIVNFPLTHLVIDPGRLGTQKHNQVKAMPDVAVVVQEWLLKSARIWNRAPEKEFCAEQWKAKLAEQAAARQAPPSSPPPPVSSSSAEGDSSASTETQEHKQPSADAETTTASPASTQSAPPSTVVSKPPLESILVKQSRVGADTDTRKKSVKFTAEVDAAEEQRASAASASATASVTTTTATGANHPRRPIRRVMDGRPSRMPEVKGTVASGGTFDFLSKIKEMGTAKPRTPMAVASTASSTRTPVHTVTSAPTEPTPTKPPAPAKDMDDAFLRLIEAEEEEENAAMDSKRKQKHGSSLKDELASRRVKRAKNETARPAATEMALYQKAVADAALSIDGDADDATGTRDAQQKHDGDDEDDADGDLDDLEADILDDL